MEALDLQHDSNEQYLFINSLKLTVKAVLFPNGNKYPSVPKAHAIHTKE
jgi:hypothetical protein